MEFPCRVYMENLNLVEILKDCPKGTKLYSPALGECALEGVIDNNDYPIKVKYKIINNDTRVDCFTKDGYILLNKPDAECMLFPSKYQRDWSKWQRPFVKGDILVSELGNIILCSHIDDNQVVHYHCILYPGGILKISNSTGVGYSYDCTLANDFQKQKLFDALKKAGYKWNAETKTLEEMILPKFKVGDKIRHKKDDKTVHTISSIYHDSYGLLDLHLLFFKYQDQYELVPDKFDITTLQPFGKVLCRDFDSNMWGIDFFEKYNPINQYPYSCLRCHYKQCVPYNEGTKDLLDTTDNAPEKYINW